MTTATINALGKANHAYPDLLKEIQDPPENLFFIGDPSILKNPAIAIVGTRKATHEGAKLAEEISFQLASRGFNIVSGLALGIDSAAHKGALRANGKTIAVLGSGIERIYPTQNENLAKDIIASGGTIISEYPNKMPPFKYNLLQRNRITSGLSIATIIIEAPFKSGAVNIASWTGDQGKPLFVVPGPVRHPNYMGSHKLIRDGATLVTSVNDILEDLGIEVEKGNTKIDLDENETIVFNAIENSIEPISIDDLIEITGFDIPTLSITITNLAIKNAVIETPNGYGLA